MRIVTYGGAVSLDGFLTGPNESIDWIQFSRGAQEYMAAFWKNIDAILMGRKTYAFSVAHQPSAQKTNKKKTARKPPVRPTYVFSRTLESIDDPNAQLVTTDAAEFVRGLKRKPGKNICLMGGGELAQSLLAAGLVDEIGLNIHPVLLGSGVPVFRDIGRRMKMTLTECRQLEGGCILARYQVQRGG